jgi:hypothetical protein
MSVDIRYVAWHLLIDGDNAIWPFILKFIEPSRSVNVVAISVQPDATRRDVLSDMMHHLLDKPSKPSSIDKQIHLAVQEIPRLSGNWSVSVRCQGLATGRRFYM